MVIMRILIALIVAITLTACGKKADAPTKTAEQEKAEKDAATKAVRDNPVYGDQFKALDKAKASAAAAEEAAKKTEDAIKKMDEQKKWRETFHLNVQTAIDSPACHGAAS